MEVARLQFDLSRKNTLQFCSHLVPQCAQRIQLISVAVRSGTVSAKHRELGTESHVCVAVWVAVSWRGRGGTGDGSNAWCH